MRCIIAAIGATVLGAAATLCGSAAASAAPAPAATCLARPYKDASDAARTFPVLVLPSEARDYQQKGFAPGDCSGLDLASYRKQICEVATVGNSAVQARLEEVLGVLPAKACASAKLAEGTAAPADPTTDAAK